MSKAHSALDETEKGAFKRTASAFRNWIEKGGKFPPVAGRYHLYVSYACPWAARCLAVRSLMGLNNVISVSVVHPTWQKTRPDDEKDTHCGWVFHTGSPLKNPAGFGEMSSEDATIDHVLGTKCVRDIYELSKDTLGKYSVPILFDKEQKVIVNNESSEIMEMLAKQFNDLSTTPYKDMELYPENSEMKDIDDKIYNGLNNGVYRSGFAQTQQAYEAGVKDVFETLEWLEERLGKSRYILGDKLSQTDVRAYVTLVRFDPVYVVYFKCCNKMIREFPNIFGYLRDLYQISYIKDTTNMGHITKHYFTSHPTLNKYAIIPQCGTDLDLPHDRATRSYV